MSSHEIMQLLSLVVLMSALDSINPCTFAIYTTLLIMTSTLHGKDYRHVKNIGLAFIVGVFITYYALGLGLLTIIGFFEIIPKIIGISALILGTYLILANLTSGRCEIKVRHLKMLRKAVNPYFAFLAGAFLSLTLLPCSGGPYIVTLLFMEKFKLPYIYKYGLLLLYNTIFVLPLILILTGLYHVEKAIKGKERLIRTIEGIILACLGLFILLHI
ncbi:MAG: hypothetical protein B6U76_11040 [Desulfurococcales archaeon ex4484_217_2]|nr:MAG: hypothetical protein B6U76_11040 [Desulfurococcales archaeon ex4484_217_2]